MSYIGEGLGNAAAVEKLCSNFKKFTKLTSWDKTSFLRQNIIGFLNASHEMRYSSCPTPEQQDKPVS